MAKRKYARKGELHSKLECCNKKCKWQGKEEEREEVLDSDGWGVLCCPKCSHDTFYRVL